MLRSIRPSIAAQAARSVRFASSRPVSTPTIIDLEARWNKMSAAEQEDVAAQLAERQKGSWVELTVDEKRAAWFISYGHWGPRKPVHPEGEVLEISKGIFLVFVAAAGVFSTCRLLSQGDGRTMTREWQKASNEILKEQKANPFRGYDQIQVK